MIIKEGSVFSLAFFIITIALYLFCINRSLQGKSPKIRRMPGIDAIDEAVKRAVEMGRPIFYSTGIGRLDGGDMAMTVAGLTLLGYTARLSANLDASFTYIAAQPVIVPVAEDLIRTAYMDKYKPSQINYVPGQIPLMGMALGEYERSKPAANFILGALYWETVVLAEAGAAVGAMQIGGTGRLYQIPFIVAMCDYALIGEELMAAGTYISQEPVNLGTILASDLFRLILIAITIIIAITGVAGYNITNIFSY